MSRNTEAVNDLAFKSGTKVPTQEAYENILSFFVSLRGGTCKLQIYTDQWEDFEIFSENGHREFRGRYSTEFKFVIDGAAKVFFI